MNIEQFPTPREIPEAKEKDEPSSVEKQQPSPDYGPPTLQEEQAAKTEEQSRALSEAKERLEELLSDRNPSEEIDTKIERERIKEHLQEVEKAKEKAPAEEKSEFEDIGRKLEIEEAQLGVADEYNDTLGELYDLQEKAPEDFESVLKTGKKKNSERLRRRGGFLREDEAKALAQFSKSGGMRRMTWGAFRTMQQIVDAVLNDLVVSPIKRIIGLGG